MTTAVSTLILNSLIAIGEKTIGGSLSAAEGTHYLGKLNAMMESWSLDRSAVYSILQENFPLATSTATYTIGSGGTFNTDRPVRIVNAFIRDSSNFDCPVNIVGQEAYAAIKVKSVGTTYPSTLYYDAAYVNGLATIYLYPAPSASLTLYINSYKSLQSFASVTTDLALPPGYQRAIESNFAIEASPGLKSVPPELVKIAKESLAAIRGINLDPAISRMDSGVIGRSRSNILTGP